MIHRNVSAIRRTRLPAFCCALAVATSLTGCVRDEDKLQQIRDESARLTAEIEATDKTLRDLRTRRDALKIEIPTTPASTPEDVAKSQTEATAMIQGLRQQHAKLDEEIRKWESTPKP